MNLIGEPGASHLDLGVKSLEVLVETGVGGVNGML